MQYNIIAQSPSLVKRNLEKYFIFLKFECSALRGVPRLRPEEGMYNQLRRFYISLQEFAFGELLEGDRKPAQLVVCPLFYA